MIGPDETIYRSSDDKRTATIEWCFFGPAEITYNGETLNNDVYWTVHKYVLDHWEVLPPGEGKRIQEAELQQYREEHSPILISTEE